MLTEKEIDRVNKIISTRVFNYKGGIISTVNIKSDIDFKIKLKNYKEMISVGTPTQYMVVDIDIIGLNDNLSKLLIGQTYYKDPNSWRADFENHFYYLFYKISEYISSVLSVFEGKNVPVKIGELKMSVSEEDVIY
jgi:hypothetical protein